MVTRIVCVSAVFASVACSSMGGMSDHTAAFRSALADARAENTRHADHCAATTSMTAMGSEMERHGTAMEGALGDMMGGMNMMSECSCCDMASMQSMMSGLQAAESDHRVQMASLTDVAQARMVCKSYTDGMQQSMHDMGDVAASCMGN